MITVELQKHLQDTRCAEGGNICTHFDNIQMIREELTSLGTNISEQDFLATILGLLPKSYGQFISAITATASVLKQELNPDNLIQTIIDEYHCQSTRPGAKEKGTDAMFFAENIRGKPGKRSNKDIKCCNCHKKGHKKAECWAKGGKKEGQGPRSKAKTDKEGLKKEIASVVVEGGVWMAIANDSGDEQMADNKFDNFTISEEELLFEDEDRNIMDLTTCLKQLLKIPNPSEYVTYQYNNPNYFLNPHNFTNSTNDCHVPFLFVLVTIILTFVLTSTYFITSVFCLPTSSYDLLNPLSFCLPSVHTSIHHLLTYILCVLSYVPLFCFYYYLSTICLLFLAFLPNLDN